MDDPDDDFTDTNCDGIDGDKAKAVFVAPTGSDVADGTMEKSVATLTHGIELAIAAGKDVFLCKGDYSESTIQLKSKGLPSATPTDCAARSSRRGAAQR